MRKFFSTKDVHSDHRFEYWHEVACRKIVHHDSEPECRASFQASIQVGTLAETEMICFENSAMSIARTRRQAEAATGDYVFVCRQIAGSLGLEQYNRDLVLRPGDVTLVDPLLPYTGKFSLRSELLVLKVPRAALECRLGKMRDLVGRNIKPSGEGGLMSSYLMALPNYADRLAPSSTGLVLNQVFDLLAVSLAKTMESETPKLSSAASVNLLKIRTAIESRLSDPRLDDDAVAEAAGVSVRYANSLLAEEGMSLMRLVQARRLERCRAALEDPMQAHRTLSEIAFSWGFSDMTHFGRRFKMAYGILPSEYRRLQAKVGR